MPQLSKSRRLREFFFSPKTELMPLGVLPIHAQMCERAGFGAFHISGGMCAWWLSGEPDAGLMTRSEVLDNARRIVDSVDIPVYADADTGYGGIQNVRKTVQQFIRAGLAGCHIEDQLDPKKAGGAAGIALVSDEEAIGRLNAAIEARDELDPDFVITARTDGYGAGGGGLGEAVRRAKLYREKTKADVIFLEGLRSWEEGRYALSEVSGPAYVIASRHAGRAPSISELTEMGQAMQVLPIAFPGVQEVWNLVREIAQRGEAAPMDDYIEKLFSIEGTDGFTGYGDGFIKPTYEQVRKMEEKFLPQEQHRDYEGSIHD
ncbi:isocitrate lyase/PEP mutase family protein [Sphingobium mellinum]|uniref:isocitrate lyase/PEP mutase family protein n=1 Tax=Sphingobium mellinum TaxID=1387166 RepID=UPI0030EB8D95